MPQQIDPSFAKVWGEVQPRSVCKCGHTGDGEASEHLFYMTPGHGACRECACPKFTWADWTAAFKVATKTHLTRCKTPEGE